MPNTRDDPLTDHIKILGIGKSEDEEMFAKLRIRLDGTRDALISLHELESSAKNAFLALNAGLVSARAQGELRDRLQRACTSTPSSFDVVTNTGVADHCFVWPDETITGECDMEVCLPRAYRPYQHKFGSEGTLRNWKRVAALAEGNPTLMLAVAHSFCGPIVDLMPVEVPMLQIVGEPGSGKTAIAAAAGSIWGGGTDGLFLESWNNTLNKLELVAQAHHATLLVLDETRTADAAHAKSIGAVLIPAIMRLSEGRAKGRWTDVEAPDRYRTPVLSTSNYCLDEMARMANVPIDDAVRGRMIDVPLVGGVFGAFGDLHGKRDHAAFAVEILNTARENHGVAGEEFVSQFVDWLAEDEDDLTDRIHRAREIYLREAERKVRSTGRDMARRHQRFATIFASARLAMKFGVLPWKPEELLDALIACENGHLDLVEQAEATATARSATAAADPVAVLQAHARKHHRRFVDLRDGLVDPDSDHDHATSDGYISERRNQVEVLFSEPKLEELCGSRAAVLRLKERLRSKGWLLEDENRPAVRRTIWSSGDDKREYVIAVKAEAFGAELFDAT